MMDVQAGSRCLEPGTFGMTSTSEHRNRFASKPEGSQTRSQLNSSPGLCKPPNYSITDLMPFMPPYMKLLS